MKIGFVGLGIMGRPMAANLINGGHELHVHDVVGVPADLTDPAGNTLLMLGAYHGHAEVVRGLARRGPGAGPAALAEALAPDAPAPILRRVGKEEAFALQDRALASLDAIHDAGRRAGLAARCFRIGSRPEWIGGLTATPGKLGAFLGIAGPAFDQDAAARVLRRRPVSFVKWDARPPNAVVTPQGGIAWFDWEHCGTRNRLDDIVWFLGDESIIDRPGDELRLLKRWVPRFNEGGYATGPADYAMTLGALHCAVRLSIHVTSAARAQSPDDWRTSLAGRGPDTLSGGGLRLARRGVR